MVKRLFAISLFLLLPVSLLGAPAISGVSGTIDGGEALIITGSGFGSKSTPGPTIWDNFESGTNGATITGWDTYGGRTENYTYSNANNRTGSALCYRAHMQMNSGDTTYENSRLSKNGLNYTKIYASYWIKWNWGTVADGQIKHGIRIDRNYPTSVGPRINGDVYPTNNNIYWQGTGTYVPGDCTAGIDSCTPWGASNMYPSDTWVQVEIQAEQSTVDTENGTLMSWVGKATGPMVKTCDFDNSICLRTSAANYNWQQINILNWAGNGTNGSETTLYFDDFYADTGTWQRVVLGDNANYDNCTRREIQIPTEWDTGEITVTINQGAFGAAATAYLYVVDEDGAISDYDAGTSGSQGYPVTFGEEEEPGPAPPTLSNVTISNGSFR